jgi:formylglycine-generating enzyme required for sulfatase activity
MQRLLNCALAWTLAVGTSVLGMVLLPSGSPASRADGDIPVIQPAIHKPYTETIPESAVKFDMVAIPGGTFVMGTPSSEPHRSPDEGPQHAVTILPFWMGKCEVTWDEYDLFWRNNPGSKDDQREAERKGDQKEMDAISRPTPPYNDETKGFGRERYPVLAMTHHAAMEYCRWLSEKTGRTYRLPTEAEWEWACRAGTQTSYFFGNDPKPLGDYAWYATNSEESTHPVGQKKPNPWGLYDIYGNVAEWCLDHYQADFYATLPRDHATLEPACLPTSDRFPDSCRGGCWADEPPRLRSGARRASDKSWIKLDPQRPKSIWWLTSADFIGFRLVRPVDEAANLKGVHTRVKWESR